MTTDRRLDTTVELAQHAEPEFRIRWEDKTGADNGERCGWVVEVVVPTSLSLAELTALMPKTAITYPHRHHEVDIDILRAAEAAGDELSGRVADGHERANAARSEVEALPKPTPGAPA